MTQGTRSVACLVSFLLHGGLVAFLWSLHGGERDLSWRIVEVFSVSESVPGSTLGGSLIPQRPIRNEPRRVSPRPSMPVARTPISFPASLSPTRPDTTPTAEHLPTLRPSTESSLALAGVSRSATEEEAKPGPGLLGGKDEIVTDGRSTTGITGPLILPGGGYQVRPAYPEAARRTGIEGTTSLNVRILEDGSVGEVIVAQSAGHAGLDQAAIDAVQRWRFEPARHGGHPVPVWVTLPIRFRLE